MRVEGHCQYVIYSFDLLHNWPVGRESWWGIVVAAFVVIVTGKLFVGVVRILIVVVGVGKQWDS